MAATHSYVITVGTTPVADGSRALRRAARHGHVSARHARGVTVIHPVRRSPGTRTAGAHRAGVHRAGRRSRGVDWAALQQPVRAGGRHRATRSELRARRHARAHGSSGRILRAALPVLLLIMVSAVFLSAWFSATGAVAFASVVR